MDIEDHDPPMHRAPEKIGRNQPCPCGSGKKFKKCCLGIAPIDLPGRPDAELDRLAHALRGGYEMVAAHQHVRACEIWTPLWQFFHDRLRPTNRTCDDPAAVFAPDEIPMADWLADFVVALLNASRDDRRYADLGIKVCTHALAQFSDESDSFKLVMRADLAELYCAAGRIRDGEQIFLDLIRDQPDSAIGYVRLADLLTHGPSHGPRCSSVAIDLERATSLLQQAILLPDAADFDVALRLAELGAVPPPTQP
jgi:hypothetical protein